MYNFSSTVVLSFLWEDTSLSHSDFYSQTDIDSLLQHQISSIMTTSNPSSSQALPQSPPKRADSRQQVFVGFGIICLASLIFHAVMARFIASQTAASSPKSATIIKDHFMPSGSELSKSQLQTVLKSIEELSDLVKERTASINRKPNGCKSSPA